MKKLLVVGAASAIAEAVAREFAARGAALFLVARSLPRLEALAADLHLRGAASVAVHAMDARDDAAHAVMLDAADAALGGFDAALVAHGTLPDQAACERDSALTREAFETNGLSAMLLAGAIANRLEARHAGCLAVISSVAGDRGRASNYVYGAAKAAVSTYCEGLAVRLRPSGVRVVCIKPGFVDTPMTAAFDKKGPLWAQPGAVAKRIFAAMQRDNGTVYVPGVWWLILFVIRHIPQTIFLRLRKL